MNRTEHLLFKLSEECAEVAQRASKAAIFGIREIQPGQKRNNAERIVHEYADLIAVAEMLEDAGVIRLVNMHERKEAKKRKVEKFMEYAREQGTLSP